MTFAGVLYLRTLRLWHLGLKSMPPITPVKSTLEELFLDYNNISTVPSDYFFGFKKLEILLMQGNTLYSVPNVLPLRPTIINLQLGVNNIHSITGALNGTIYPLLRYLGLGENMISRVNTDMLSFWPSLNRLDLQDNRIIHLPKNIPENKLKNCSGNRDSICFVNFAGNPVHCDTTVEEIIIRRRDGHKFVDWNCHIKLEDLQLTVRNSPPYLSGWNLVELGMCKREGQRDRSRGGGG